MDRFCADGSRCVFGTINTLGVMEVIFKIWKSLVLGLGGFVGWLVAEFKPTFPLILVAVVFIISDAWTAFCLDRRVHKAFPEKTTREKAKFTSFAFGKVITRTIPKRLWLILLAYMVEHWVFISFTIHLHYIVTGAICFEQFWSMLENESSCRSESESRFWRMLQRIMVDKTERHFSVGLDELKTEKVTDEQIESVRARLREMEAAQKKAKPKTRNKKTEK